MSHILLDRAFNYLRRKEIESPKGFYYNRAVGAWMSVLDSTLLVNAEDYPVRGTKKEDVETGEDQKGQ